MDFEVSYSLDNEQQFWEELDEIVSAPCQSHALIDNVLRSYLSFTTNYKDEYLQSEDDVARCSYKLLESGLFAVHKSYVRRQIIYSLLQEDTADTLHLITSFLLLDGRQSEETLEMMSEEGVFRRLLELIQGKKNSDAGLQRMLLESLYEMSRIQRLRVEDLKLIEDAFVTYLLHIIECVSDDVNDPYHYPVIKVLLVLNEQYMVSTHDPSPNKNSGDGLTNKVIKALSLHGSAYRTFGENIILLLNRESETSLQLLILKLLYLLFTTPPTYEYFYTNDLRVLVDVMIRNLLDLPLSSIALRHTYLRVLYPLLAHTQLKVPSLNYKQDELRKLLRMMISSGGAGMHFGAVDDTTKRLVNRCAEVPWLKEIDEENAGTQRYLGIGVNEAARGSSLSVLEVAAHTAKPGVQTPSREKDEEEREKVVNRKEAIRNEAEDDAVGTGNGVLIEVDESGENLGELQSPFEVEGEA